MTRSRGERASPVSDVFAWGCLVVFLATGKAPHSGAPVEVYEARMRGEYDLSRVSGRLREAAEVALRTDPRRRVPAGELLEVGKILGVNMSRAEADDMLRAVDADGNGKIDLDEFRAALAARESDAQAAQPDAAAERAVDMSASLESMLGG